MNIGRSCKVILAAMAWCAMAAAPASSIARLSPAALFQEADVVVWGQVASVTKRVVQGEPRTLLAITVKEEWKGASGKQLIFEQPQGETEGITQEIPGLPAFHAGEEIILFLRVDKEYSHVIVGGKQGKLTVGTDSATGSKFIWSKQGTRLDLHIFRRQLESGKARKKTVILRISTVLPAAISNS